ncbi:DUF6516 family protein [Bdellovibrionota bacterium FG-1]
MKAVLRIHHKLKLQDRFTVEITIHEVVASERYRDGVKYGLICIDEQTKARVLFDNHHPKGPHIHLDRAEQSYTFLNEEQLIADFKKMVLEKMGVKL